MPASDATTRFTRVSLATTYADPDGPMVLHVPSGASLIVDGTYLSRVTTASASSAVLADGELAIAGVDADSAVLAFRSGNTTYTWSSTTAGVL